MTKKELTAEQEEFLLEQNKDEYCHKRECDFCQEKCWVDDLVKTEIDEGEDVLLCENCRAELERACEREY